MYHKLISHKVLHVWGTSCVGLSSMDSTCKSILTKDQGYSTTPNPKQIKMCDKILVFTVVQFHIHILMAAI